MTYGLGGSDYAQFKATVGIDENGANATSSARVIIEADGQILFNETLKRKDKPKGVVLAVKGVKQLRVIVEADTPFNGNYVTLRRSPLPEVGWDKALRRPTVFQSRCREPSGTAMTCSAP